MDLQMPEMDGYQATARLRSEARFTALPIIAMTAHATLEERQRCLDAGMNDHVAKPIEPATLFETVGRFYKPAVPPGPAPAGQGIAPLDDLPAIDDLDAHAALLRVGGNKALYLKLLRQFVEKYAQFVAHVSEAQAKGDTPLAERLAHTLKGVAGNIGATGIQSAAGVLEKCLREGASMKDVEAAKQRVASSLDPLVAELHAALHRVIPEPQTPDATSAVAPLAESREAAARLTTLLSDLDPGAADFVETHRGALRPLFGETAWPDFEKLVHGYAFADAQARLEHALKSFAGSF